MEFKICIPTVVGGLNGSQEYLKEMGYDFTLFTQPPEEMNIGEKRAFIIEQCKGDVDYVIMLDDDVRKLRKDVDKDLEDPVMELLNFVERNSLSYGCYKSSVYRHFNKGRIELINGGTVSTAFSCVKVEDCLAVGNFKPLYAVDDVELSINLMRNGYNIGMNFAYVLVMPKLGKNVLDNERRIRDKEKLVELHYEYVKINKSTGKSRVSWKKIREDAGLTQ